MERTLDARGLACPLPLVKARAALADLAPGDVLVVLATDPEAPIDLGMIEPVLDLVGARLGERPQRQPMPTHNYPRAHARAERQKRSPHPVPGAPLTASLPAVHDDKGSQDQLVDKSVGCGQIQAQPGIG